jgi:hypothetical protein
MKYLNQKGGILVEFIIVTPIVIFLLYTALNLNGRSETKLYLQNGISNLKGKTPADQEVHIDEKKTVEAGVQYATFSKTLRDYQKSFDQEKSFQNIKHSGRTFKKKDEAGDVKIGSSEYKTLLTFQKLIGDFLYNEVIGALANKGIYFKTKGNLKVDTFEFKDGHGNLLFDKELEGMGAYIGQDATGFSSMNFVEKIVYQSETGYHPGSDNNNITLPGAGLAFTQNANHWGVLSNSYYSGASPKSSYRSGNIIVKFVLNAMSATSLIVGVLDHEMLDSIFKDKNEEEREKIKENYDKMTTAEKKRYVDRLKSQGKLKSGSSSDKIGTFGKLLLKGTKLKKGFSLNCPYNYRVSSNCITPSLYGSLLPVVATIMTAVSTIGDFFSGGSVSGARTALKSLLKEGLREIVNTVAGKIEEQIKDQISSEIGKIEQGIQDKISEEVKDKVEDLMKVLSGGNIFGI